MADGFDRTTRRKDYVSLSKLEKYRTCRRSAWYHYKVRARPKVTPSPLAYGIVVHRSTEDFFKHGKSPKATFTHLWKETCETTPIQFTKTMDMEDLQATGERVLELFESFWHQSELSVVYGADGQPLVELSLAADIGDNIVLWGKIDLIAMTVDGRFRIYDVKTPASPCSEIFPTVADQLTDYQVLAEANKEQLGIDAIDEMGYLELIKRKVPKTSRGEGPVVHQSSLAPARSSKQINQWLAKVRGEVRDMRAGRYPKDPGPAWRTACDMCDFAIHCIHGTTDGLDIPEDRRHLLDNPPD